jgi:hypothetical protein
MKKSWLKGFNFYLEGVVVGFTGTIGTTVLVACLILFGHIMDDTSQCQCSKSGD